MAYKSRRERRRAQGGRASEEECPPPDERKIGGPVRKKRKAGGAVEGVAARKHLGRRARGGALDAKAASDHPDGADKQAQSRPEREVPFGSPRKRGGRAEGGASNQTEGQRDKALLAYQADPHIRRALPTGIRERDDQEASNRFSVDDGRARGGRADGGPTDAAGSWFQKAIGVDALAKGFAKTVEDAGKQTPDAPKPPPPAKARGGAFRTPSGGVLRVAAWSPAKAKGGAVDKVVDVDKEADAIRAARAARGIWKDQMPRQGRDPGDYPAVFDELNDTTRDRNLTPGLGDKGPKEIELARGGHLTAHERQRMARSEFALPGKGAGPKGAGSGSYPIPDASHARNALARAAQHASPAAQRTIRAAVHRRFPGIGEG